MPNIVQNYNETTNDPEYPLTYEEAILDPDGNPIKGYVKEAVVAPQYDPTTGTYAVGDPVMDDKKYYRCNTAVASPEDFDPTKWTEKTISEEIDGLNQNMTDLKTINYDYNNARFIGVFVSGSGVNIIIPTTSLAINPQASNLSIYYNNSWLNLTISSVTARDNGIAITGTTATSLTHGASYLARCSVTATLT